MRLQEVVGQVLPPVFVLAGLGFAAFGAHLIRTGRRLRDHGVRVPGTVVRLRWDSNDSGGGTFYPLLRFRTADGAAVETESDVGTNPAPAREGQQVTVVYDPEKPRRARMDTMLGQGAALGAVMVAFGLVAAAVALAVTVVVLSS
ncbi:DUF3592 domain-containing protein [Spirillospora sp. NPDC047279]|uniref:DUF3592 domain-containing protein n=1 Tax=Spirillospora sp. NPDC047279 TaxID=3155478 RepID=UPI0033BFE184